MCEEIFQTEEIRETKRQGEDGGGEEKKEKKLKGKGGNGGT